jgi:hypothetical protein
MVTDKMFIRNEIGNYCVISREGGLTKQYGIRDHNLKAEDIKSAFKNDNHIP